MSSEGMERVRDQVEKGVLMMGQLFGDSDRDANRQAAIDWGMMGAIDTVPFTPYMVGPGIFATCHWPDGGEGVVKLNDAKGAMPGSADLDYGVTLSDAGFHGIKHIEQGEGKPFAFVAIMSGTVSYANKVEAPHTPCGGGQTSGD